MSRKARQEMPQRREERERERQQEYEEKYVIHGCVYALWDSETKKLKPCGRSDCNYIETRKVWEDIKGNRHKHAILCPEHAPFIRGADEAFDVKEAKRLLQEVL